MSTPPMIIFDAWQQLQQRTRDSARTEVKLFFLDDDGSVEGVLCNAFTTMFRQGCASGGHVRYVFPRLLDFLPH